MGKPRANKKTGGFTLVEMVVALFLLTVGLLASSSTLVAVFKSRDFSKSLMTATNLAQKQMEDIRSTRYVNVESTLETYGDIPGYEKYRRTTIVTANADDTLKTVVVDVFCSNGQTIRLETLISR